MKSKNKKSKCDICGKEAELGRIYGKKVCSQECKEEACEQYDWNKIHFGNPLGKT